MQQTPITPTPVPNPSETLNPRQLRAIDLLLSGMVDREVAEAIGVDRHTVGDWRRTNPAFRSALQQRREELLADSMDSMRALLPPAVKVIHDALTNGAWDPTAVALRVIQMSGLARACREEVTNHAAPMSPPNTPDSPEIE